MSALLVVLTIKTLITPSRVSTHFVWPFKIWLVLDFFQQLMYWISEHSIYHLRGCRLRLPSKIPTRSTVVVTVQPEIPHLLRDNFAISLSLLLVLFNPLVLVNSIHKLAYTVDRFPSQKLPQAMLGWHAKLESANDHIVKVAINLVKHFPISV